MWVVPAAGTEADPAALRERLGQRLARELNPLFHLHDLVVTTELPRTASQKLLRRDLRDAYSGRGMGD